MTQNNWEMVIGLEVHAQIIANSKLFSGASATFGAEPNEQVSFVDAAMPGMLPVLNKHTVNQAIKTGLGINAVINKTSVFERKNYFYADLPQGYQISQFAHPIVGKGEIIIDLPDGSQKSIGVTRLHMEQDAGKSLHDQHPTKSFVDLNRSGSALMEIVSEPDLRSADDAAAYLTKLRQILRYLETCDGNMEEGSMRCDVNLSIRKSPDAPFGTRTEVKNVNSIKAVVSAIAYEFARQIDVVEAGGTIVQETRLWDPSKMETRSLRSKEDAHDYRYFPCPDLLPLVLDDDQVENIRKTMPELPDARRARLESQGLSKYDAAVICAEKLRADYFEEVAKGRDAKTCANWVLNELLGRLNKIDVEIEQSKISANQMGELVDLIKDDTISGKIGKDVLDIMVETGDDPSKIVEEKGLKQVVDLGAIEAQIDEVLANNADNVQKYKDGNEKLFGFFVGQVMKVSQGKASPTVVNEILKRKLG